MLLSLYVCLLQPGSDPIAKAAFMVHVGLFILWQPLIRHGEAISGGAAASLMLLALVMAYLLDGWILSLWVILLAALVGGRVLVAGRRRERASYLLALASLILALLTLALPAAVPAANLPEAVRRPVEIVLGIMMFGIAFLPKEGDDEGRVEVVDAINSVLLLLLLAVLVLGSLAGMVLFGINYAEALLKTLMLMGLALLLLGWLWNPHLGFSGIESMMSRYLMSLGVSAEQWLEALTVLAARDLSPSRFVAEASAELRQRLPWVRGIAWQIPGGQGEIGQVSGPGVRVAAFSHQALDLTICTRYPLPPSLVWHFNLLVQFLAEYHADKLRQERLRELSYLEAVHETGARLTHDVKNLLQSLQTLVFAAEHAAGDRPDEFRALVQRQLPVIATRLEATLEKLRMPATESEDPLQAVGLWWREAQRRQTHRTWVRFDALLSETAFAIPARMAHSVLENLVSNAETKRQIEPALNLHVGIEILDDHWRLSVADNGKPLPADVAERLFQGPIKSDAGLGIGLFQAARLAAEQDCRLTLADNQSGRVVFVLEGACRVA
jgi:signal transduction histidine kinase